MIRLRLPRLRVGLALLIGLGAIAAAHAQTTPASATAPAAPAFDLAKLPNPPIDSKAKFVAYMVETRHEDPKMVAWRFDRAQAMIENKDVWREKELKAYLLTPREEFVLARNRARAYDHAFLDIGYGVTISGPHLVGRMTSTIDVKPGERVLEIGTGSGYQSAILSHLTDQVYTIEIIEPLGKAVGKIFTPIGYDNVHTRVGDGYYGWPEVEGGFDIIIVTCAAQYAPPDLFKQIKPGGRMVIPIGQPFKRGQVLYIYTKDTEGKVHSKRDMGVFFIPMTGAIDKNPPPHGAPTAAATPAVTPASATEKPTTN